MRWGTSSLGPHLLARPHAQITGGTECCSDEARPRDGGRGLSWSPVVAHLPRQGENTLFLCFFFLPLCLTSPFSVLLSLRRSSAACFSAPPFKESRPGSGSGGAGLGAPRAPAMTLALPRLPPRGRSQAPAPRSPAPFFSSVTQPLARCSCLRTDIRLCITWK